MTGPEHRSALTPARYLVAARRREAGDVTTLTLEPVDGPAISARPGQFNMVTAFGAGEVAISVSSPPRAARLEHTVRAVGAVTHALADADVGHIVGIRGAFGTGWGVDDGTIGPRRDVVVIAGGIGLAPLRGAIRHLLADPRRSGRVVVLIGARTPDQIIFGSELDDWRAAGAAVAVTVDRATRGWTGPVGVVTGLLADAEFDPAGAVALVCGPEIMIRLAARALGDVGVDPADIYLSLERNMQCGVGWCGHCQLGPLLVCRDGPVVSYAGVARELLAERER